MKIQSREYSEEGKTYQTCLLNEVKYIEIWKFSRNINAYQKF